MCILYVFFFVDVPKGISQYLTLEAASGISLDVADLQADS